jgi:ABC-type molybdenum transport system ATPase subunit/photorepair protein PhrA
MRIQRGVRETGARELVKISAKIPDRARLEDKPDASAITYFFITDAARRVWGAINQQLNNSRGALFWLGGPAGSGKTHFLNYVLGLSQRAGAVTAEPARNLTIVVDPDRRAGTVEQQMLERLAHELNGAGNKAGRCGGA